MGDRYGLEMQLMDVLFFGEQQGNLLKISYIDVIQSLFHISSS